MNPIVTRLNRIPGKVMPVVNVNQYDKSTGSLLFEVFDGDVPFNITGSVTIMGTKPDKTGFVYSATASGNEVTADLEQQMAAVAGDVICELRITEGSTIQGTLNFILRVEPAALSDDTVISETELPLIERAVEVAAEIESYVADARQSATAAAQSAQSAETIRQQTAAIKAEVEGLSVTIADTVEARVRPQLSDIAYNSASQAVASVDQKIDLSHTQYLKVFSTTGSGWQLQSGGKWDGWYGNSITITNVYNPSAHVRASGATLDDRPTDEVQKAVSKMYFDLTGNTLTAYAEEAPTVDIYVSVEGVQ